MASTRELLSRKERFAAYGPQAVFEAWMALVVPKLVSRNRVKVVGIEERPEIDGLEGVIGELVKSEGCYPVYLDRGELRGGGEGRRDGDGAPQKGAVEGEGAGGRAAQGALSVLRSMTCPTVRIAGG